MTLGSDSYDDMFRFLLNDVPFSEDVAERLLSGRMPVADAPADCRGVAALFETAAGSPVPAETAHRAAVVGAALAAYGVAAGQPAVLANSSPRRPSMLSKLLTAKAAAAATVAVLGLGTAAAAMTGSLPTQSQGSQHAVIGLATASSNSGSTGQGNSSHGNNSTSSGSAGASGMANTNAQFGLCTAFLAHHPSSPYSSVPADSAPPFKALMGTKSVGDTVIACKATIAAHNTSTGANTGSDTNGKPSTGTGKPANAGPSNSEPPVSTPNSGGTGTADTASGGASSAGTGTTAGTDSSGASTTGSGNATGH